MILRVDTERDLSYRELTVINVIQIKIDVDTFCF